MSEDNNPRTALVDEARNKRRMGDLEGAAYLYLEHLARHPDDAEMRYFLGMTRWLQQRHEEAHELIAQAIAAGYHTDSALFNFALLAQEMGRLEEAEENYRKALSTNPMLYDAYNNLGLVLQESGRLEEAVSCFNQELKHYPESAYAHNNIGQAYKYLAEYDKAADHFQQAIKLLPDDARIHWNLSVFHLIKGKFREGWFFYDARFKANRESESKLLNCEQPLWEGQGMEGKRILVYGEQGLGDEIMFASCLPDLARLGGDILLHCNKKLTEIFRRSFPFATLIPELDLSVPAAAQILPDFDFHLPIGNLPAFFRNEWKDFPAHTGYLSVDYTKHDSWKQRLAALGEGLKIGISWRGGIGRTRRQERSITLEQWLPVLQQENCHFVSLQYTDCITEIEELDNRFGIRIHHWQDAIDDYDETASLVSALDLVISVTTAVIHLGGALGKPVWVMVPYVPEWRYLAAGEKMPWYPSNVLFRQTVPGVWEDVIKRVALWLKDQVSVSSLH